MSLSQRERAFPAPSPGAAAEHIAALAGWRRALACFAAGALSVLGFAPFHAWPLLFLTLTVFIWLLDGVAARKGRADDRGKPVWRQAFFAGWWFGFGFFLAGFYWLGFAFVVEADKYAWLMPLPVLGLPGALALFPGLAAVAAIRLWRPGAARIFVFAAIFFAADWLRGHILTGFPWNIWGYGLAGNDALAQSASIVGIYGLTLLSLLIFASPAALGGMNAGGSRNWVLPAICVSVLAALWGWGSVRLASAESAMVGGVQLRIVQANIPQAEKWKAENRRWIFERYLALSGQDAVAAAPTHVIWPESSTPFIFMMNDAIFEPDARRTLAALNDGRQSLILGGERATGEPLDNGRFHISDVYNSLFVVNPAGQVTDIYDKIHLVPFGEYLPFEDFLTSLGITQLTHRNSGFASGSGVKQISLPDAPPFLPLICYEIIFPGMAAAPDGRPGWLLNLTNDAWFGPTSGPYQHLHQARLRAIEQGLPVIRAANTGVSAVIDAHGRVLASLPLETMGIIDHGLPVALEPSLYTQWGENCLMLLAILIFILYRIVMQVE